MLEVRPENIQGQVVKDLSYQANEIELGPESKGETIYRNILWAPKSSESLQ